MKSFARKLSLGLGLVMLLLPSARAAGSYSELLAAADTALGGGQADTALQSLDSALALASSDGEKALALGKKGYVLAFLKQDYAGARTAVDEALKVDGLAPVAKVTALQVLAQCKMKVDKDFASASANLREALALEGVDWAKPALTMSLGDCSRSTGDLESALSAYRSVLDLSGAGADLKAGAHLNIGFIYQYDRKDGAKAREAYAEAVKLQPDLQQEVDGHLGRLSDL